MVCTLYAVAAVAHTWPLAAQLGSQLPGLGLGDNVSFVWNFWWMREALWSPSIQFLQSPMILVPLSGPLVLHTHTALPAWFGATVLSQLTVVQAYNVVILLSLALNGLSAYVLGLEVTGRRLPSFWGGLLFLLAPAITERLMGHLNLVQAWPLLFFAAAFVRWWKHATLLSVLAWSLCFVLTLYCDYYYAVYAVLFALTWTTINALRLDVVLTRRSSQAWIAVVAVACVAFAVGVLIAWLDRPAMTFGDISVSTNSPRNAFTATWGLLLVAALTRWRFGITRVVWELPQLRQRLIHAAAGLVLVTTLASPLLVASWHLWRAGDYVTQPSSLKSSPTGVDVATFVLGPPFSGMLGKQVRAVYERFELDPMDGSGWLGAVMLLVFCWSFKYRKDDLDVRSWLLVAAFFTIWALGPYLMVMGTNTGLLLPQAVAHVVPIVNNARMPSRAMAIVAASGAVLTAILLARHVKSWRVVTLLVALIAPLDLLGAPLAAVPVPDPGVYRRIAADRAGGAVLAVPFGVGDGFGDTGLFDRDVLFEQTVHGHPLVGGFLARLPASIRPWYLSHEPYATLAGLSGRDAHAAAWPTCAAVADGLKRANVTYVVLYRSTASPEAVAFVGERMPLAKISEDSGRTLYRVRSCE